MIVGLHGDEECRVSLAELSSNTLELVVVEGGEHGRGAAITFERQTDTAAAIALAEELMKWAKAGEHVHTFNESLYLCDTCSAYIEDVIA